jgi:CAAX prenyl protease-like protein
MPAPQKIAAYTLPMAVFIAMLALNSYVLKKIDNSFWLSSAEYWVYPLQTVLCGGLVFWFRRDYQWSRIIRPGFAIAVACLAALLWISPQVFFGFAPRTTGFDPEVFSGQAILYTSTVALRFLRLVIVVPLVEEIFWRGFLLRYLIAEEFERVPFGKFSWLSFTVVTMLFALSHSKADWVAALLTGALYNFVAYRTKSLSSCVLTHALTNLLLGFWIMKTGQWGFW